MKRKMIWSLTAMLAGTGFAAAQDVELASVQLANSNAARTGTLGTGDCSTCGTSMMGCSGNVQADFRFYGRLEGLVWKLGHTISDDGSSNLPTFRASMPYGFRTTGYNLTDPLNPVPVGNTKDISGLALLEPNIQSGSGVNGLDHLGARITLGMALDSCHDWYAEFSYFQLETRSTQYTGTAAAQNIMFEPGLFDVTGVLLPTLTPVNFPADFTAVITGASSTEFFGLETNVMNRCFTIGQTRVSAIYGLRYLDLNLKQGLVQALTATDDKYIIDGLGNPTSSTTVLFGDYEAHNQFFGAQVGARFDTDYGRFFINGFGKFAFGDMRQTLITNEDVFNPDVNIPFDVYPAPTSLHETRDRLAFVLEGNLSAGFHVTDNISLSAGYNVMVMTRVAQFNNNNVSAGGPGTISLGSATNPVPVSNIFTEGRYYAHGLNLGLELRY